MKARVHRYMEECSHTISLHDVDMSGSAGETDIKQHPHLLCPAEEHQMKAWYQRGQRTCVCAHAHCRQYLAEQLSNRRRSLMATAS